MGDLRVDQITLYREQHVTIPAIAQEMIIVGQIVVVPIIRDAYHPTEAKLFRSDTPDGMQTGLATTNAGVGETVYVLVKELIPT